ncbi:MAG: hypothetical protein Q8936_21190 [Bacillota bacterium]|nr:hypothetical protein [Bacillota bacterium]
MDIITLIITGIMGIFAGVLYGAVIPVGNYFQALKQSIDSGKAKYRSMIKVMKGVYAAEASVSAEEGALGEGHQFASEDYRILNDAEEPAFQAYFFKRAYEDFKNTYETSRTKDKISSMTEELRMKKNFETAARGFYIVRSSLMRSLVIVWGNIIRVVFSGVYLFIIALASLGRYSLLYLISFIEKFHRLRGNIFTACPYCYEKQYLPYYICPSCGAVHKKLTPGRYGIIKRKCCCGNRLPSTFFNGRSKLKSICPSCKKELNTREAIPLCIPVMGGESVGKTCFIYSAVSELAEEAERNKKWSIGFLNSNQQAFYKEKAQLLKNGVLPLKTPKTKIAAFNFLVNPSSLKERLIYLYDVAGEMFEDETALREQRYYEYCSGIVFIIDPLSIHKIADKYKVSEDFVNSKPSSMELNDILDFMLINLQSNYGIRADEIINKPLAIIINKVDVFNLQDKLKEKMPLDNEGEKNITDFQSEICKEFLKGAGEEKFLRKLEYRFSNYKFFPVTILGQLDGKKEFNTYGSKEPMIWLLNQLDNSIFK